MSASAIAAINTQIAKQQSIAFGGAARRQRHCETCHHKLDKDHKTPCEECKGFELCPEKLMDSKFRIGACIDGH